MRKIAVFVAFVAFVAVTSLSSPAQAEWGTHGGFDATFTTASTSARTGGPGVRRSSVLAREVLVGLEASLMVPYGVGANLLFYVYNGPRSRAHH